MQEEVTFAGLAFVFMSYLLVKTPVLDKLIDLLNSVLGRLRGGPVYTATVAAGIFGAIAHVGAAVTAAVGSVTVPWMKRSGVRPEIAATIVAGCAGMGVSFPFTATMFILVGGLAAHGRDAARRDHPAAHLRRALVPGLPAGPVLLPGPPRRHRSPSPRNTASRSAAACARGGRRCCCSLPILIPLALTRGPIAAALGNYSGVGEVLKSPVKLADGTVLAPLPFAMPDVISLITWIPVLMIALVLFLGRRAPAPHRHRLVAHPRQGRPVVRRHRHHHRRRVLRLRTSWPSSAWPSSSTSVLDSLDAPAWITALAIGMIIVLIAIPLTA